MSGPCISAYLKNGLIFRYCALFFADTVPVQSTICLYIKRYVFSNKLVLSQLLSLLLVNSGDPESSCTSCTVHTQMHLIHLEAFFSALAALPCHRFGHMCICRSNFGTSQAHNFGSGFGSYGRAHCRNRLWSRPSEY